MVLGGSGGARRINQLVAKELSFFEAMNLQIIWQCGKFYFDQYQHFDNKKNIKVMAFIDRMDLVYAAADIVVSRSGASSVSELCLVGKPVIFIPSPNVAEDHQTKNANAIVQVNGALLIKESNLDDDFENIFKELLQNEKQQNQLSQNIKKLAKINATTEIVDVILKLV